LIANKTLGVTMAYCKSKKVPKTAEGRLFCGNILIEKVP
jgi:hypothetical protein